MSESKAKLSRSKAKLSRRHFLEATTLGAAGLMVGSSGARALSTPQNANNRVNLGVIGAGGQGSTLIRNLATVPNSRITGMCDIFPPNLNKGVNLASSQPKTFTDYRKLMDGKEV
ncbi:MAG TPA: twin-arginine translocation signal domain-containing protein, partial [Blastocatellia bacterium]|nr:twin-arginine translocation signal domain-containing protein [Blastocatellia bacterium]